MVSARRQAAAAAVQALSRRRAAQSSLARAGGASLPQLATLPASVAASLIRSPRMAARIAALVAERAGLSGDEPPSALAAMLEDPEGGRELAGAVGLALALARSSGALLKSDVEALRRLHGSRAVECAFRSRAGVARVEGPGVPGMMGLLDVRAVRAEGESAILAWGEARLGSGARWLSVLFPDARAAAPDPDVLALTDRALADWMKA